MCKRECLIVVGSKWRLRRCQYKFTLRARGLRYWDEGAQEWRVLSGSFGVIVDASSRDLRLAGSFTIWKGG